MQRGILALVFVLGISLNPVGLFAQGNNAAKKMIVGTWKIGEFKPGSVEINDMGKEEKELFEGMIKEMVEHSYFKFMEDGKFELKVKMMGQEQKEEGTWSLDGSGKVITTTNAEGQSQEMKLRELTSKRMVFKDENSEMVLVKSGK